MEIKVFVRLDGSSATYNVRHEIDGIYKVILVSKAYPPIHFPEKIILIRAGTGWESDCRDKTLVLAIGQKINEQECVS